MLRLPENHKSFQAAFLIYPNHLNIWWIKIKGYKATATAVYEEYIRGGNAVAFSF